MYWLSDAVGEHEASFFLIHWNKKKFLISHGKDVHLVRFNQPIRSLKDLITQLQR